MTIDYKVKRRKITLAATRDPTTGWRIPPDWAETDIEMIITPRGQAGFYTPAGYYGRIEALGQCADPVSEFDQILAGDSRRWEVQAAVEIWDGDNFIRRDCALVKLPLYEASPAVAIWTKTRPKDARERMKDYIDGYAGATLFKSRGQQYDSRMSI